MTIDETQTLRRIIEDEIEFELRRLDVRALDTLRVADNVAQKVMQQLRQKRIQVVRLT